MVDPAEQPNMKPLQMVSTGYLLSGELLQPASVHTFLYLIYDARFAKPKTHVENHHCLIFM